MSWDHHLMAHLGLVTVVVRDYDKATSFYVGTLGFELREDTRLDDRKRWVVVCPRGARETGLLLAEAANPRQRTRLGDQTGGRVGFFLHTGDFDGDHARMRAAGVTFLESPRRETYGMVAVFEDLYGNRWDLIQPTGSARGKARSLDERQLAEERRAYSTAHKASTAIMITVLWVMGNTITDPTDKVVAPTAVFSVFAVALTATHLVLPLLISMWRLPDLPADEAA
jgi:catechol 2,3-dioxygenase-like lactoylglutathione lyase family enzyme